MGKVKKILAGVLVVVIAGSGITAGLMQLKKNSQKTVAVTPVSGLLQEFYTPSTTLDGTITSSATQTVNGDKDLIIDQIYVTKGDAVKKGDPLVSFDTTLVEMELNIAKLKKQKLEQDLNKAVNRLNSLQIFRHIRILQQMDSVTERRMILIPEKMICRNYHQRQRRHWMIIPHILIPITEKVIRISLMVTSRFIRNWMQILFRLQEVAQRTIHMYICVAVQKKK